MVLALALLSAASRNSLRWGSAACRCPKHELQAVVIIKLDQKTWCMKENNIEHRICRELLLYAAVNYIFETIIYIKGWCFPILKKKILEIVEIKGQIMFFCVMLWMLIRQKGKGIIWWGAITPTTHNMSLLFTQTTCANHATSTTAYKAKFLDAIVILNEPWLSNLMSKEENLHLKTRWKGVLNVLLNVFVNTDAIFFLFCLCCWQSFFCCHSLVWQIVAAALASTIDSSYNSIHCICDSLKWHFNYQASFLLRIQLLCSQGLV